MRSLQSKKRMSYVEVISVCPSVCNLISVPKSLFKFDVVDLN
jgi:hypothetical protein